MARGREGRTEFLDLKEQLVEPQEETDHGPGWGNENGLEGLPLYSGSLHGLEVKAETKEQRSQKQEDRAGRAFRAHPLFPPPPTTTILPPLPASSSSHSLQA